MNTPTPPRCTSNFRARSRYAFAALVLIAGAGLALAVGPALWLAPAATALAATAPPSPAAAESCTVDAAAITWGFKESFRSYISGSIANGEWTVADGASYTTPSFAFAGGTGDYDPVTQTGLIRFPGSIAFTGHGGILNTTVANPQLKFVDADTAILVLDVAGTTQQGDPIDSSAVEFATLDLGQARAISGSILTIAEAPVVLTAAGATAFGTYEEGEQFDPLNASITLADDCVIPPQGAPENTATPVIAAEASSPWAIALLLVFPAAALVFGVVVLARERPWRL